MQYKTCIQYKDSIKNMDMFYKKLRKEKYADADRNSTRW